MTIEIEKDVPLAERKSNPEVVEAIKRLYYDGAVNDSIFIPKIMNSVISQNYLNAACTNVGGSGWFSCRKDRKDRKEVQQSSEAMEGFRIWKKTETPLAAVTTEL